ITKIVNALTAQSEIGAPMAAMYLLDHPDHYTDHKFERFYWKRYINEVRDAYITNESKYKDVCLYDWIRLARKSKQVKRQNKSKEIPDNEWLYNDQVSDNESVLDSDSEYGDECKHDQILDDSINENSSKSSTNNEKNNKYHKFDFFLDDHPQCETHRVRIVEEKNAKVPDFIGGILPRKDKGNREEYCLTMLSLFKPWRSGLELKTVSNSWSESFDSHEFSLRQYDIMNNFNLRYECRDARDDFAAQRKAKGRGITDWPSDFNDDVLDDMDNNSNQAIDINTTDFGEE
ncbi:hypothetical protein BDY19DRAFT_871039, partial [Irpex rosettiformis]